MEATVAKKEKKTPVKKKGEKKAIASNKKASKENKKRIKKNKKLTSIEDVLIILKANKPKEKVVFKSIDELVKAIKNSKPKIVTIEAIKPEIENLNNSINVILQEKLEDVFKKQEEMLEAIKTVKIHKPSQKLITFFKKYKTDISKPSSLFLEMQLDSIEEELNDEEFNKNLKQIPKSDDVKLKKRIAKFKPFLDGDFINKLKSMDIEPNDEMAILPILMHISSFISSVKSFSPKEETATSKES